MTHDPTCSTNEYGCFVQSRDTVLLCRFRIEQELGTEIKPIPSQIEEKLYCV